MFSIQDGASVAVIGAGVVGLSVAYHLADAGVADVTLLDGAGFGAGATAIQPGGVRQQWGSRVNCLLARESRVFYSELDERFGRRVEAAIDPGGYVFVAEGEEALASLRRNLAVQQEVGVPSVLLSAAEVGELVPGLATEQLLGAAYCAEDGYFDRPQAVVAGFAEAALARGARLVTEHVVSIERAGDSWSLRLADGSTLAAGCVVVAAGADTPALLEPLDIRVPIRKEARHLFYSDPIRERLLEPLVVSVDRHFAAKHLADGSVLASDLSATGDPASELDAWRRRVREGIAALLPVLEYVSFPVHVAGTYDLTPDRQMIVGPVEGAPGLVLAAGMSGRGFMMAPAVGRLVAGCVTGAPPDPLLDVVSLSRFEQATVELEPQVV